MTQKSLQTVLLMAATVTTGLMAGLFAAFAYAVMPGLRDSSDRSFVEVMQNVNKAILNGWFMSCFVGSLILLIGAALLAWRGHGRQALPWIVAALAFYLLMFLITSGVNVPLNDRLARAGDPRHIADLAAVRQRFEARWVTWNVVRAVANLAAFACLVWALVVYGAHRDDARRDGPRAAGLPSAATEDAAFTSRSRPVTGDVASAGRFPAAAGDVARKAGYATSWAPPGGRRL
ncbi:anthrone oxygenase family protein [Actinoallomurus rhizosphaericola]|uniref:anthrone oxygenase family protein n=1 Tax=Actinoallomurus rhizosphaericola TaxID=2952536 RepID=UPI002091C33D|nr:anthrone oxygenase family protein [Actinoallomurus rhizosphaericola]MCO5994250.1 DUF1772 domain-containing protein [Actinoallomurus rhizosphaericola]